ncbi:MAG TPA: SDR family oxidoreductase [Thermoanaerobaculia bacterium]|jgi:short-subunit dehydrogenase|nr:SDR family oxidoreductase [Thermoanaerobaculia bacterium]
MENKDNSLALITGASSGIGLELAKCFAKDGHDVILVAEDSAGLDAAAAEMRGLGSGSVDTIVADLSDVKGSRTVFDEVRARGRQVDVLVDNAGVGVYGKFIENDLDEEIDMINLNTIGFVAMAKFFVPPMVQRGSGRVLITASVASRTPTPYMTIYGATKAFVYEFAQGLREELHDTGVTVTALMPGPTDTNFFERAGAENSKLMDEKMADPAEVAQAGYDALMRGDDKIVVPLKYKIMTAVNQVVPDPLVAKQSRKKHEPRDEERGEGRP